MNEMEITPPPEFPQSIQRFSIGSSALGSLCHGRYPQSSYRRSYPPSNHQNYYPPSNRRNYEHPRPRQSYPPPLSHPQRSFSLSHECASQRVMEIHSIRRRLSVMRRHDKMQGYPYHSDAQEGNELYSDSLDYYNYDNIIR